MKALPLWQPWATLVALEVKRIETRSWKAPASVIGERIAIHATKTTDRLELCHEWPFNQYVPEPEALPLGALIATAVVERAEQITAVWASWLERNRPHEFAFGNYEPGRWAWTLRDVEPLAEPIRFRGSQGIFDVPDELVGYEPPPPAQGSLL